MSLPEDDAYDYAEDRREEELKDSSCVCNRPRDCPVHPEELEEQPGGGTGPYSSHGYDAGVAWYGR